MTQIEGSAGGGLVPWAVIAGYGSKEQVVGSVSHSQVSLKDYRLDVSSVAVGLYDKVELSYASQRLTLSSLGGEIKQDVIGAKIKVYGDVIYTNWPQVSLGLHHKILHDGAVATALGAKETSSHTDVYIAATKVHLGLINGYNLVWNATGRMTQGNETGLLGFGAAGHDSYKFMFEASAGVLLNPNVVVGVEFRQKPNNLALGEDDWFDAFVAYIPNKNFSVTLAWTELGTIAGAPDQEGLFINLTGKLW